MKIKYNKKKMKLHKKIIKIKIHKINNKHRLNNNNNNLLIIIKINYKQILK